MDLIAKVLTGERLSLSQAQELMDQVMQGALSPVRVGALLAALAVRGETPLEIAGFARSMRAAALQIHPLRRPLIDTCGTGGDRTGSFNISTAAAFVAAGAGVAVAKHGNRKASGKSGSADVLEALGVRVDLPPEAAQESIDKIGIGFLFARTHHPAMANVAGVRAELGVPTVFNLLGPLTNPAGATHQLVGVYDPRFVVPVAESLAQLGLEAALVVHGEGLDELALGRSQVAEMRAGQVKSYLIDAQELGLEAAPISELAGGNPEENAHLLKAILAGELTGAKADIVVLNAGAAIWLAGVAGSLPAGLGVARESLASGQAARVLQELIEFTQSNSKY